MRSLTLFPLAQIDMLSRPIFSLQGDQDASYDFEAALQGIAEWAASASVGGDDERGCSSTHSTPRLGASWSAYDVGKAQPLTPAELALAAYDTGYTFAAKRPDLFCSTSSLSSSTSSLSSSTTYDDLLTPDTSVCSASPCRSPLELLDDESSPFTLPPSVTSDDMTRNSSSSSTVVVGDDEDEGISFRPAKIRHSLLASRPLLARCLTAPLASGMGMQRCISSPVATQEAHDDMMRGVREDVARMEVDASMVATGKKRESIDDLVRDLHIHPSLPFPYNLLRPSPDIQLRPSAGGASMTGRPGLSRATTFDSAMLTR